MTNPICPKCEGAMTEGFVVDHVMSAKMRAYWVPGVPQERLLGGVKAAFGSQKPVTTWSCDQCGYMESYVARHN